MSKEEVDLARKLKASRPTGDYEKLQLGRQIRKARTMADMSQSGLAELLHTSQSVVARMEAGKQNFSIETLARIAEALGRKLEVCLK